MPARLAAALPTVSLVHPNLLDDVYDGTIAQCGTWLKNNLSSYVTWAMSPAPAGRGNVRGAGKVP